MAEISVAFRNSGALGSDFAASKVGLDLQIHLPVLSARNHKIFGTALCGAVHLSLYFACFCRGEKSTAGCFLCQFCCIHY